jgi:pimeloyl-ACP methyl ester carboxylesterase
VIAEKDVALRDGRTLRSYDSGAVPGGLTLIWHHGSPHTGAPLEPLLIEAAARDIRLVTYARPSYGGSTPLPGRDVASAADDVAQLADALGIASFAVMGASGGGPHALACAALLPDRVTGVASLAGVAPFTQDFPWFAGMAADGALRAALVGRDARELFAATDEFDAESFGPADWAALSGTWSSLGEDAQKAEKAGPDGLIDDDVAFVSPWGFDLAAIVAPVLIVQGGQDRVIPPAHGEWLARTIPGAELWFRPDDGHVSILHACPAAMNWIAARPALGSN